MKTDAEFIKKYFPKEYKKALDKQNAKYEVKHKGLNMSLDNNKIDFERALDEMNNSLGDLEACVKESILSPIRQVIDEYEGHYSGDIDDLISERDELQEELDKLTFE